jgi:hypothetical protein
MSDNRSASASATLALLQTVTRHRQIANKRFGAMKLR